jgi:hypothetical protein
MQEGGEQIDRDGEQNGGIVLRRDFGQGLQEPQLQGLGMDGNDLSRFRQARSRLKFALCIDDVGPPLAFGFCLSRHGALHLLRQVDVLHLDRRDFDPPIFQIPSNLVGDRWGSSVESRSILDFLCIHDA